MTVVLDRKGSSKDIYRVMRAGKVLNLRFHFSDRVSILDLGGLPVLFPGLGQLRCAIAGYLFQRMTKVGFHTHYLTHNVAEATMDVYPFEIEELGVTYNGVRMGRILGIEIIDRRLVTPKLLDRYHRGELPRKAISALLSDDVLEEGSRLHPAFVECTTKYQAADRYVTDEEAATLANVPLEWLKKRCYSEVKSASDYLFGLFEQAGFIRHDGKFEGGVLYSNNRFIFADSMSPDEMRLIGPDGRSYDKDPVRQWYQQTFPDWYAEVVAAKKSHPLDKSWWPTYPAEAPPPEVIEDVVARYRTVAERLGAL
ncbi:MAG TPA: phosphoribosylaminoimidazolesuccinocarboxamide synthase [Candidatus Paceibacterota bacterium]